METKKDLSYLDEIELIRKRFELMVIAKYRDKDRIRKASEAIDRIRKKIGSKNIDISMTEIVRKLRDEKNVTSP